MDCFKERSATHDNNDDDGDDDDDDDHDDGDDDDGDGDVKVPLTAVLRTVFDPGSGHTNLL